MARRVWRRRTHPSALSRRLPSYIVNLGDAHTYLQEDRLLISDPKALQYIHQSAGYRFCKAPGRISLSGLLLGPGIIAVDGELQRASCCPKWHIYSSASGEVHKRQRRIMQPGFGTSESKALVPIFFDHAKKVGLLAIFDIGSGT